MSTAVITNRLELDSIADSALKAATRFWFVVTVVGQLVFAFALASFYGMTALRGNVELWSRFISHGYVPGDRVGNLAVSAHVFSAMIIMLAGAVQLVPQIRSRFPAFHRWNGRIYMLTTVTLSVAGLYMTWIRGSVGDFSVHLGSTINVILIWLFGALALRHAIARNFRTHRRWAVRFFLVVSASWFFRIGFFLALFVFKGPVGFDPATFRGPFPTFMSFAQYLIPLAILESYLQAKDHPGAMRRLATAGLLFVATLAMAAGVFAVATAIWIPQVKAGFDPRKPIMQPLSATIASSGVEAAVKQYHSLKASRTYNFDEDQLNNLGYQLLRAKKVKDAIRIFQLNVEAYPQSSNVYDSLGEGYMNDGEKALAVANYKRSLELNPKNGNAVKMLQKMNVQ